MKNIAYLIVLLMALLATSGCARSKQARYLDNEGSGFLKNYSQLEDGEGDQAMRVYRNPRAEWQKYRRVIIDPVAVYAPSGSDIAKLEAEQRQSLVNYFYASLRREFGKTLKIVETPGPNTMRIRIALTDAESSNRLSDTTSSILPYTLALSALKELAVGRPIGVGDVQIEAEFLDSISGERLAAGIDRRVGGKSMKGKLDKWDDVKDSFDFWSSAWHGKFRELRKGTS